LIDYIGPNIQLAHQLRKIFPGLPIVYYIAPQEWVWGYAQQKVLSYLYFGIYLMEFVMLGTVSSSICHKNW